MPSKSAIFSTILSEITKGIGNVGQNQNQNPNRPVIPQNRNSAEQRSVDDHSSSSALSSSNVTDNYQQQQGFYPPPSQGATVAGGGGYPPPSQGATVAGGGGYPPPSQSATVAGGGGYPPPPGPQQPPYYSPAPPSHNNSYGPVQSLYSNQPYHPPSAYPPPPQPNEPYQQPYQPYQPNLQNPLPYSGQQPPYPSQQNPLSYSGQQNPSPYPSQQPPYPGQQNPLPYPSQQAPYPSQQNPLPYSSQQPIAPAYSNQSSYAPIQAPQVAGISQPPPPAAAAAAAAAAYPNPMAPYGLENTGYNNQGSTTYPNLDLIHHTNPDPTQNFQYKQNFNAEGNRPSIRAFAAFNANNDAEILRKAMKGMGCDKSKIIDVICRRSNTQRQQIAIAFKAMYGKDLIKGLRSELTGDFEDLILALMEPSARYDAIQLYKAMEGLGTKESVLIEIMSSRTNAQIMELKSVYRQMYGNELEKDLIGETSGHFKRLLVSLCAAGRDETMHTDPLKANHDARTLYRAGEQRLGTDESSFNAILAAQNHAQLRLVFQEYQKITNHSIEKAIESEFSGDIKDGLLAIVSCVQNRSAYFAKLLYNTMAGLGTRDNDLIRIIVTRSEIDLADIRQQFEQIYKKSLESMIKGDCSGAYKDGLIAIVRGN